MIENMLSQSSITELLGHSLFGVWQKLRVVIDETREMKCQR